MRYILRLIAILLLASGITWCTATPVWAIGTGVTASPEQAEEVHLMIRELLIQVLGPDFSSRTRILYGGSVKADNVKSLMAKPNIEFSGQISDENLARTYARAKAFIFPQEEDFGIVAIEAMASGKPIIAFRGGDIVEHVREGEEGLFFEKQNSKDIIGVLKKFDPDNFDPIHIRERSLGFDKDIFKGRMKDYVEESLNKHKDNN